MIGKPKKFLALLLLAAVCGSVSADNIHGRMIEASSVGNGGAASAAASLRLEEIWGVVLENDRDLLRGVEIQFELPEQVDLFRGTYAVFVYGGVSPAPEKNKSAYRGSQLFFKVVDGGKKLFLHLPLESAAGFGQLPDTYVHKKPLAPSDFPLVFTVMPIMKGIPDRAAEAVFTAQVRPIFKNAGKLVVALIGDSGPIPADNSRLFIDDKPLPYAEGGINLEPGIRRVRIEKDGYASFVSTVGIDKGKVSRVEAYFRRNESFIRLNAPAGSRAFLDGKSIEIDKKELTVEPGEHTLSLKIGDYQVSKKFFVEPGKSYGISLFLDILINED